MSPAFNEFCEKFPAPAKHFKRLGPPEDVEYIERERHAVAVHEACHAVVAYFNVEFSKTHKQLGFSTSPRSTRSMSPAIDFPS